MKNDKLVERRQLWIDRVQQQIASGLNKKEWCHKNQVSLDSFYYWSQKLDPAKAVQKQRNAHFTELPLKAPLIIEYQGLRLQIEKWDSPANISLFLLKLLGSSC